MINPVMNKNKLMRLNIGRGERHNTQNDEMKRERDRDQCNQVSYVPYDSAAAAGGGHATLSNSGNVCEGHLMHFH